MPKVFTEQDRDTIRAKLLQAGLDRLAHKGYGSISIDEAASGFSTYFTYALQDWHRLFLLLPLISPVKISWPACGRPGEKPRAGLFFDLDSFVCSPRIFLNDRIKQRLVFDHIFTIRFYITESGHLLKLGNCDII